MTFIYDDVSVIAAFVKHAVAGRQGSAAILNRCGIRRSHGDDRDDRTGRGVRVTAGVVGASTDLLCTDINIGDPIGLDLHVVDVDWISRVETRPAPMARRGS